MKHTFTLIVSLFFVLSAFASGVPYFADPIEDQPLSTFVTDFNVYPNPSPTGEFTLRFSTLGNEDVKVRVYNLIGRLVYQRDLSARGGYYESKLDLSRLPRGVYVLEIANREERITKRLSFH